MRLTGRTRHRQHAQDPTGTRQRIFDAAIRLFAKKGPVGASIGDICEASGANRRMIYHYFTNKEGLYLAVLESVYGRIRELAIDAAYESKTLAELIDALMEKYFAFLQQNPEFVAMLRWENAEGASGLAQLQLGDFRERYLEPIRQALRREWSEDRVVREEDAFFVVLSCLSMCGYCLSHRHSLAIVFGQKMESPQWRRRWLDHAKAFVLRGLGVELDAASTAAPT